MKKSQLSKNEKTSSELPVVSQDTPSETWLYKDPSFLTTRFLLIATFVILTLVWAFFGYKKYEFLNMAPSVVAGNFHLDYRKIPYNVPSIDFIFSHDIDPASVTSNSFKMYPFVKGAPIVKNGNTISYVLQEPLKIGTKYLIELAPDITTTNKVAFGKTASYEVEAIGGVGVTKMIPEGVTTGLSKNPLFIFNLPVVPLSTLESREKLPCPVVFEPAIKGRCTWPSGNILEYKLDAPLSAATKYTAKIVLGSEFLFPLDKPFESTFSTTPIWRLLSNNENGFYSFSSRKGLEVIFSAPVKASDLEKYLQLYSIQNTPSVPANPSATPEQQFKEFIDNQEKNATPKDRALEIQNALNNPVSGSARPMAPEPPSAPDTKDTKNTYAPNYGTTVKYSLLDSEGKKLAPDAVSTKFFISGETGPFDFNQEFTVFIAKWLPSAFGNIPQEKDDAFRAGSRPFVTNTEYYQPSYSETGAVNGEQYVSTGLLPTDKPVIQLILDDEIDVKTLSEDARTKGIYLENSNKERVNCTLSNPLTNLPEYEGSPKYVEKPNTKMLKCSIEQKLPTKTKYRLVIEQKVYTGLKQAWGQDMETPPDFVISDIVPASATEICVYSSTPLPALYGANAFTGITVSPKARLKEVSSYVRYDNNGDTLCPSRAVSSKMEVKDSPKSTNALEKILQPPTVASQQEENLVASLVDIRMLGEKEYTLGFSTVFKDMYNNPLTKDYSKKILSPALKRKDSYVFFMPEKEYQTIPASAPIRLPLQTVNASQVFVEACAISPSELASYQRENYRYVPNCSKPAIKKAIQTKNLGWDTSSIQVDLSDGFFPDNTYPGDILFVRGSLDADQWTHEWPEQRDFKGVYMRSNIALGIVSGNEKSIVFATEYDGKTVPSDVTFSFQGCMRAAPVDLPKWNKDKQYYEMKGNFSGADGCILVASGASGVGYVSTNVDATSNYDFGQVGGLETSTRDFAYTYTDRPMYRAGDTIYFKGILRSFVPTGYTKSATKNVKLRILQDDWTEVTTFELPVSANGNFSGEFNLPKEMKTGRHFFEISDKDTTSFIVNDAVFFVEQYSKPVFKTTVKNTETNAMMGDTIKAHAQASYYFGGALPGAKVEWTVRSQNYFFDPKDYSQYRFGADSDLMDCIYWGSCSTSDMLIGASVGTLNETGIASYDFTPDFTVANTADTPEYDKVLPKEKIVSYTAQVTDPNTGKTISATDSTIFHTTDGYVGIQSPYWTTKGEALKVSGIVLDHGAKPMAKSKVTLEYIKTEWLLANKTGVDGYGYDDYTQKKTLAHSEELISGDNGEWRNEWMPTDGGQYILRATYTGKNGKKFVSESYAYISTDSYMMWNNGNATVTELVGEKALYKPGETAVFTLKTPVNSGKFLVTVEKDDAILDSFVRDVTSFGEKIEIPVKKEYLPNVYVRVYVIGADSTKGLPVYKRALSQFRVATGDQALDVKLTTKKPKYLPGEGLEVEVSVLDMAGKPVSNANGSIAVVDQSVLALAGNPKKNPFAFFYEMKRYLGTTFFSSLTYLVEKIEVKNTANGEKGGAGDGNKGGDTKKKRGVFKDTAYWQAEFTTNSEWKAVINTGKLPDNLTTWEIEAIVTTPDTKVGRGETTITTRKPVMISENLPRFFRTGDSMEIAPVIFNQSGKKQSFTVTLSGSGITVGSSNKIQKTISLEDGASMPVSFEVTANNFDSRLFTSYASLELSASTADEEGDTVVRTLPVLRSEIFETVTDIGVANGNATPRKLELTGAQKERSEILFQVSATLFGQVIDGIENLLTYPYGCVEQITSAVIPHVAVKNIHDSLGLPYDLKEKKMKQFNTTTQALEEVSIESILTSYVLRVMTYEHPSGGFTYWNGNDGYRYYADFRMTSYVMKTLRGISDIGISVDTGLVKRTNDYLRTRYIADYREGCNGPKEDCSYTLDEKLAALEALALWSRDAEEVAGYLSSLPRDNWNLSQKISSLSVQAAIYTNKWASDALKQKMKKQSDDMIIDILNTKLVYDPRGAYISPEGNMGRIPATAEMVRLTSILRPEMTDSKNPLEQILDNMTRFLSREKKSDGSYGSTRDTALVLEAFAARMKYTQDKPNFTGKIQLNGQEVYSQSFGSGNILETFTKTVPLTGSNDFSEYGFETVGTGKMFYSASLKTPLAASKTPARDEGFYIATEYYDLDAYNAIARKKEEEWVKHISGDLPYDKLQYPKEITEYLSPVPGGKIGQLLWVEYRMILSEHRDKVAFESMIPAGSEAVNTRLATETKTVSSDTFFDREEFLDDRYFGFAETLAPGEYRGGYAIRLTQAGRYEIPATKVFEFYTPEVFWQTTWKVLQIRK